MQEQEGEGEPAHHARRPMNAFLIFCKRHRSVVREKYPNLENRSITKILGEWWANLDKEEKACYTVLAKQYKDAFFDANPDFKWYKLPAPPIRTLNSRPREHEKPTETQAEVYHENESEKTNNNSTKIDLNRKQEHYDPKPLSMFTPGKLADEAQMGGISRLLDIKTETKTPSPFYSTPLKFNSISTPRSHNPTEQTAVRNDNIRELQNALSETTKMFEEDFDENTNRHLGNDQFTNQDVIDQVVNKRYSKDEDSYQRNYSDDDKNKSGRSCKGKRYQEFMAVGGLIINKRQKRDNEKVTEDGYNATCSWDHGSSRSGGSSLTDDSKPDISLNEIKTEMKPEPSDLFEPENNAMKTFKAADFDLDAKIAALPSLSLEKFQQKKRDSKRRKKTINLRPKTVDSIQNSVPDYAAQRREMVESWREAVIGSQKRKPRKISITRFEINSFASSMGTSAAQKVSPEIKLAMEAPCTVVQNMDVCNPPVHGSVDLFALATLAEVASNTSKIDGATIMENLSAKSCENASKV